MILRTGGTTQLFQSDRHCAISPLFRRRYRSDDTAAHVARQIEALQQYGYGVPRNASVGPEEIRWIG